MNVGERIQELADQIVGLRDVYYQGSPQVADAEYDAIEDELRGLIEANKGRGAHTLISTNKGWEPNTPERGRGRV